MAPFVSVPSTNCGGSHAQKLWVEVKSHYDDPHWQPVKDAHVRVRLKDGFINTERLLVWIFLANLGEGRDI